MADIEIPPIPLPENNQEFSGKQELKNIRVLRLGVGNKAINMDDQGRIQLTDSDGNVVILIQS